jgi:hypothetical protein
MPNKETLATLVNTNRDLARAMHDMLLQLYASQTLVRALLGVLAEDPDKAPTLGKAISAVAEKEHGIALGFAMSDVHLVERNQILMGMLPAALRQHVVLPDT